MRRLSIVSARFLSMTSRYLPVDFGYCAHHE